MTRFFRVNLYYPFVSPLCGLGALVQIGVLIAMLSLGIGDTEIVIPIPPNGMVADEVIVEKDLEIARQTGAIKNRVPLSRVVDFQFVKTARGELSVKQP